MALEDYGDTFNPNQFLDPALGQMLAQNPEDLIPHFAAAGIPPPGPQFAENFGPRFDAASPPAIGATNTMVPESPLVPQSGTIGDQNQYAPPPGAPPAAPPPSGSIMDSIRRGYEKATAPPGSGPNRYLPPTAPVPLPQPAPGSRPKIPDRVPEGERGRVPPTALGQSEPAAPLVPQAAAPDSDISDPGYRRGYQTAEVAGATGEPTGRTAAVPAEDPRRAAATEETTADKAKKAVGALSGVRMPPPPPQPQLRPFAGERPVAQPANNALIALLSQAIQGHPGAAQQLRLLQSVGGKL